MAAGKPESHALAFFHIAELATKQYSLFRIQLV